MINSTIDRRRILIFVAFAYAISIALGLVIFYNGGPYASYPTALTPLTPLASVLMAALMFAPTVANIATRLITREGWSNTQLRPNFRRSWRFYFAAWFLPCLATAVGGAIYYLLFPSQFDPSMTWAHEVGPIPTGMGSWTFFSTQLALAIAVSAIPGLLLGFGEEFGWRAYLLPKLMPLGPRKAALLSGAIWAVWHWPYVFMGYEYGFDYWGAPVVGPLLWVVICCFLSMFLAWVSLRSGSVWPAALGHGAINASALLMVWFQTREPDRLIGPGPVGIIGSLGYAVLALLIFVSPRALAPSAGLLPAEPEAVEEAA